MKVPQPQNTTAAAIIKWHGAQPQDHRNHLGCSVLGNACDRNIWLTWRWAKTPEFEGRILRLFDTGKREEVRLIEELRAIGVEVHDMDPENSAEQIRVKSCNGHLGGSLDGIAKGFPEAPKTWAVLECKTHNVKSFNDLLKNGVVDSKFQHYAQMQLYMGLTNLDRALYLAVCKDTDAIYSEWVHFDQVDFDTLIKRAETIIAATEPPARVSEDPAHWVCKMCSFYSLCHQERVAEVNCRTCCHSTPVEEGAWRCESKSVGIDGDVQRKGCDAHLMLPALVPFATPIDSGPDFVEYKHNGTGKTFKNGAGHYMSRELFAATPEFVTDPAVEAIREKFDAEIVKTAPKDFLESVEHLATHPDDIPSKPTSKKVKKSFDPEALKVFAQ